MRKVIISRDSVCMGDDVMAPHYMTIEIEDDMSYSDLLKKLITRMSVQVSLPGATHSAQAKCGLTVL